MKDPYSILGLNKNATENEIHKAYRNLAKEYHPDRNPGDKEAEAKFKEIQGAYDRLIKNNVSDNVSFNPFDMFNNYFDFGEVEKNIHMPEVVNVKLTWEEAINGCTRKVNVRKGKCNTCKGNGSYKGEMINCNTCSGSGFNISQQGPMTIRTPCRSCMGRGSHKVGKCDSCDGTGMGDQTEVTVNFPKSACEGMQVKTDGVIFIVRLDKHPYYRFHDGNLVVTVPVSPAMATAGGKVEVMTPWGVGEFNVPTSTANMTLMKTKVFDRDVGVLIVIDFQIKKEIRDLYVDILEKESLNPSRAVADYLSEVEKVKHLHV